LGGCYEYVTRQGSSAGTGTSTATSLAVEPQGSCVAPAGTQQFTVTAAGTPSPTVNWYVDTLKGGGPAVGTITNDGLYSAPSAVGVHTIGVVSTTSSAVASATTISVTSSPNFHVSPDSAAIPPGGTQAFEAQVCGVSSSQVNWIVDNIPGGSDEVGTVTSSGEYTAPTSPGTHKVQAQTPSGTATEPAIVTVSAGITVDFAGRAPSTNAIPAGILGINRLDWIQNAADQEFVARAGFNLSRSYADIPEIFASRKPRWKQLDQQISQLHQSGFHLLLQLAFTPKWLQPKPNSCKKADTAPPTDVNTWASLAKQIVAHLDAAFPGVVTDYEIWNEPDTGGMCTTRNKLQTYVALYAAAAPAIKQQLAADGATARVGGPAISANDSAWISALTRSPSTAPYLDFISYHNYIGGTQQISAKWDSSDATRSIYLLTQDATNGAAARYVAASRAIASGSKVQVYVDEFNTNWTFSNDCCRNDPTYAPVWNALYVSDLLNTIYSAGTRVPGQLTYYAASNSPFCIVGELDANMDCNLPTKEDPQPYPQYFAYQLMASNSYLAMNDGGYMARSISPLNRGAGLALTAFFTPSQDSILIVNPTGASVSEVINISNSGLASPSATLYQVVNGQSISSTPLQISSSGSEASVSITAPPYSVLGVVLK
jgi:hypothetical protein